MYMYVYIFECIYIYEYIYIACVSMCHAHIRHDACQTRFKYAFHFTTNMLSKLKSLSCAPYSSDTPCTHIPRPTTPLQ